MNSDSAHAPEDFPTSAAEPDVHILLPFWGDPDHLFTAVRSVLDQSDPRWRLTVLDDAYPDPRVAVFFAELVDSRVDYVRHPENIGITRNFRRAAELASAPLCCIFGSDDIMGREFVATVRDLARRSPDASIIQPAVEVLDDRGLPGCADKTSPQACFRATGCTGHRSSFAPQPFSDTISPTTSRSFWTSRSSSISRSMTGSSSMHPDPPCSATGGTRPACLNGHSSTEADFGMNGASTAPSPRVHAPGGGGAHTRPRGCDCSHACMR